LPFLLESQVKATSKGSPVPHHPGLKLFNTNAPCAICGLATPLELRSQRICFYDWRLSLKAK
jgi:hypothetical protein